MGRTTVGIEELVLLQLGAKSGCLFLFVPAELSHLTGGVHNFPTFSRDCSKVLSDRAFEVPVSYFSRLVEAPREDVAENGVTVSTG